MSYKPKHTRTKDRNHNEIAGVYAALGLSVFDASHVGGGFPDLVVGGASPCKLCRRPVPQNVLVEIKDPAASGQKAEPRGDQVEFHALWRGPIVLVRTVEEALRSVGRFLD